MGKRTNEQALKMSENQAEIRRMRERLSILWERMEGDLNRYAGHTSGPDHDMSPAAVLQTQERAKNMLATAIRNVGVVLPPKFR